MADQVNNNIGRRKFFDRIGKSILAFGLFSSFSIKVIAKENKEQNVKVLIHPSAVKRTKKGF
ncbi:MAG: hypothetical protein F9K45_07720 [Melioribacteraceae bacterium]|nr:MAG: hypothetical protein F9K45_07720 [Melioribacteraceae bacterium]